MSHALEWLKKKSNTKCWPGCGTSEIRIHCWWDYQMVEFT